MNCYSKKDGCRALTYLTVLLLAGAAYGQEAIGSATSVTPQAEGSHGGKHTLAAGGNVYHQEDIETGASGIAGLRFHDNSDLKVGPKSRVKLDKFIYDPNRSAGSVAIEAAKGSFSFLDWVADERFVSIKNALRYVGHPRITNAARYANACPLVSWTMKKVLGSLQLRVID